MPKPKIVVKKSIKQIEKEQAEEKRKQIINSIKQKKKKGEKLTLEDINDKLDMILELLEEGK